MKRVVRLSLGVVVVAAAVTGCGSGSSRQTSATTGAGGSALGKPCVAPKGPLPTGAPTVPVPIGPPPTKLLIEDLKAGTGAVVKANATITVDYIGVACSTGKIFDSSYAGGVPVTFPLNGVIAGWTEGIPGMKVGGERLLGIPPALAYRSDGSPPDIAPDETLWFVIHMESAR